MDGSFTDHLKIRKVGPDLRSYTCDAMLGKDLNDNPAGRRKAQKQVDRARVVFTTCIGASLGLLRCSRFPIVIIDEASQQTEPQSLVPLTKGCAKAILVGDHVQLRATVHPHAQLQSFDVSLFERLYLAIELSQYPPTVAQKVMLDTQYRMHASICAFSSREFYADQLRTAVPDSTRQLPPAFPWPLNANGTPSHMVFTQCDHMEDLGGRSKNNSGQVNLARQICQLLVAPAPSNTTEKAQGEPASFKVAALTPYTACAEALRSALPPSVDVSSIDGYQGREADIVVFVTVRCNVHGEIGFLKDLRRLNVAVTRAKAGLVVVGDKKTLAGPDRMAVPPGIDVGTGVKVGVNDSIDEERRVWGRLIKSCAELNLELETTAPGKP